MDQAVVMVDMLIAACVDVWNVLIILFIVCACHSSINFSRGLEYKLLTMSTIILSYV